MQVHQLRVRRLEPWDVSQYWEAIRDTAATMAIEGVKVDDRHVQHLATRLAAGTAHAWVIGTEGNVEALMLTTIEHDTLYGFKYLHVQGLKAFNTTGFELFGRASRALDEYAKLHKCEAIVARINDLQLQHIASRYGARLLPMFYKEV